MRSSSEIERSDVILRVMRTLLVSLLLGAGFSPTGPMTAARLRHTATLLPSGKVLIAGGHLVSTPTSSAELYDPETNTFAATKPMTGVRTLHAAVLLANGKVLVMGGQTSVGAGAAATDASELFDPASGNWAVSGLMGTVRGGHTATLLASGKVLVAGGTTGSTPLQSAELYDPATGTWSPTGAMSSSRNQHSAVRLPDGKILVAGGLSTTGALATAERYDPATGTWSAVSSMAVARSTFTLAPLAGSSSVALCRCRGWFMTVGFPVEASVVDAHVPVAGSYSSAPAWGAFPNRQLNRSHPPATSTLPLGSRDAEWPWRGVIMEPVCDHVPDAGS